MFVLKSAQVVLRNRLLTRWKFAISQESVKQVWDARDRAVFRAREHVLLTGPSA